MFMNGGKVEFSKEAKLKSGSNASGRYEGLNEQRVALSVFGVATALMVSLTLGNILLGVFYDTDHFSDTLFLLGSSWRIVQGLTPVLDYGHFYGGVVDQGIAATMLVFGFDAFAFEWFTLIVFFLLFAVSWIVLADRMSLAGLSVLALTFAVLVLTRYPLEMNAPITRVVATHSFFYNRFGFALMLVAGLFVALRAESTRREVIPGLLVGLLLVVAALTKPTFAILIPSVFLGLLLQRRWHGLVAVLAGTGFMILLVDPALGRWLGSVAYTQAQVGQDPSASVVALLRKSLQLPLSQPIATAIAGTAIGLLVFTGSSLLPLLGLFVVAAAGVGMAASMGGNGSLGQLAIPITIMVVLASAEMASREALRNSSLLRALSYVIVLAFALPHLLNLAGTVIEGTTKRDPMLVTSGPYQRYLSLPEGSDQAGEITQYAMFADGIKALHNLGDPSEWGIIADHGITFEYAVLGRPVSGYPLWQRASAPELADGKPIASEADIVMLGRVAQNDQVGAILRRKLGTDFVLCATSMHWDIYARRSGNVLCPLD